MTPKKVLIKFLKAWIRGDKYRMFSATTKTRQTTHSQDDFAAKNLSKFEIIGICVVKCVCDVELKLNGELIKCRLICESDVYKPDASGKWGVNPASFKKL